MLLEVLVLICARLVTIFRAETRFKFRRRRLQLFIVTSWVLVQHYGSEKIHHHSLCTVPIITA